MIKVKEQIKYAIPTFFSFLVHSFLLIIPQSFSKKEDSFLKVRLKINKEEPLPPVIVKKEEKKLEFKPKENKKPKKKKKPLSERKLAPKTKTKTPPPPPVQGFAKETLAPSQPGSIAVPMGNTLMIEDEGKRLKDVAPLPAENLDLSSDPELMASTVQIPQYTDEALDANLQGVVVVDVYIDEQGNVVQAELVKKIGYGMDERIIDSAKKARFKPRKDSKGKAIQGWSEIKFRLEIP